MAPSRRVHARRVWCAGRLPARHGGGQ